MRTSLAMLLIIAAAAMAQEPAVPRSNIWVETVKRGEMAVKVRALGVLREKGLAELNIPEPVAKQVSPGQTASIDMGQGVVNGRVASVEPAAGGVVTALVRLEGTLPSQARPGQEVDGTVDIGTLSDVVYAGRPVSFPASGGTIFKVEPDGRHAARVKVQYGRASVNQVQIVNGLAPGDRVILSNMSAYRKYDRVALR